MTFNNDELNTTDEQGTRFEIVFEASGTVGQGTSLIPLTDDDEKKEDE